MLHTDCIVDDGECCGDGRGVEDAVGTNSQIDSTGDRPVAITFHSQEHPVASTERHGERSIERQSGHIEFFA